MGKLNKNYTPKSINVDTKRHQTQSQSRISEIDRNMNRWKTAKSNNNRNYSSSSSSYSSPSNVKSYNNNNDDVTVLVLLLPFIWYFLVGWNWSKWIVRHSGAYFTAALVYVFHLLWGFWFVCELLDPDGIYAVSGDGFFYHFLDYFIVSSIAVFLTVCRYLATPTDLKLEILQKNKDDYDSNHENFMYYVFNPFVYVPLTWYIDMKIENQGKK